MKKILLLPVAVLLSFCCSTKELAKGDGAKKINMDSPCPSDGTCSTEVFKNKTLVVKTDAYGSLYYQMEDNENTSVIVYQYNRTVKGDLQDANYKEELVFEINNNETKLSLENTSLQKSKMLFGRICFCRGQTGYYKVDEGQLNLTKNNNSITFNLDFTITKVPQIIKNITTTIN